MQTLAGSIERITYYNPENGYSVIRLRPDRRRASIPVAATNREGLLTAVGNLPELTPGEYVRLQGQFVNHPKHGLQFQIEICEQTLPATVDAIRRYLGSGLIKGIGPRMAERIVGHFGLDTLEIIEQQPERLREVPDIGPKRAGWIATAWQEQKQIKDIMLFLHGHGVSTNLAVKIYKTYGQEALQVVQNDPYRLARDIFGVGFKTADKIAQSLGLAADHPSRIEAGVVYTLNQMTNEGHVFVPESVLVEQAAELLGVARELIAPAVERLSQQERLHPENLPLSVEGRTATQSGVAESRDLYTTSAVYLTPLYFGEVGVARRLKALASVIPSRLSDIPPAFVHLPAELSAEQQTAIRTALTHPLSVLTGGPGTGKTTCIQALIATVESQRKRYALCAPTGRAAKRLSEATGRPASTIHRLLEFSPARGFLHNEDDPLPVDLLVVDEASMLDLLLANHLLKALEPGTHLLFVGDVDQLPSVGAGDVLRDLIASGIAPVTRLNLIFRQAADSLIVTNAHRINRGEMPLFPQQSADFYLFPAQTAEEAANWVSEVVTQRIPKKFDLNPMDEIQVLAPMYRGLAGVRALNQRLQHLLNPPAPHKGEKSLFGITFRQGDKVMQTQNDYEKEVFNGDIGRVEDFDPLNHTLRVNFEGRLVTYDWAESDQLVLAYCISVHKSQGAEFPCVVMPIITQHYMMLQRNLLYTAVTRARRLCVLVGNRKAVAIAVRNDKVARRYTALDWRLQTAA